jgi:hypothetical protein
VRQLYQASAGYGGPAMTAHEVYDTVQVVVMLFGVLCVFLLTRY